MNIYVPGNISLPIRSISNFANMAMSMFSKKATTSSDSSQRIFRDSTVECNSSLMSIIEEDIIPRLLGAQNMSPIEIQNLDTQRALPTELEVQQFALMCTSDDHAAPSQLIDRYLNEGLTKENIFLDLITPAARYLGDQWMTNNLDFYLVTHGLVRMHSVTRDIGFSYIDGPLIQGEVRRIMIAAAPGSEHLLGPSIVSEFFRKEGWQVVLEISPTINELVQAVRNEWFDAVGLSVSIQAQLTELAPLVSEIRKSSRNPRVAVLLGGPIFTIENHDASDFGASAICVDAKEAVKLAISLIANN